MARNDNTLGAPTEGLGQTVTFAPTGGPGVPQLSGIGDATRSSGDVRGGPAPLQQRYQPVTGAEQINPVTQVILKVAGSAMQGYIDEKKTQAFVQGMQRAANGEAIKDIANGQPWYSNIFGFSADVVEGARVYTAHAKASDIAAAVEDSMPEVRKLDAPSAQAYFSKLVKDNMTGDAATDAATLQSFARALPATMRRQTKEHYKWRQEEASNAESQSIRAMANLVQTRAANGDTQTMGEYQQNVLALVQATRPAEGRDVASWSAARTNNLLEMAQAGQFHAVNAFRNAGLLDMLDPKGRTKIESALYTAENRTVARKSFEYADEIGRIAGEAEVWHEGMDPTKTMGELRALNDKFRRETGIDRDLIGLYKAGGVIKDVHTTLLREGERRVRDAEQAAKEAAKLGDAARAEGLQRVGAYSAISVGNAGGATKTLPDSIVHDTFRQMFDAAGQQGGPQAQSRLLFQNYAMSGYVNPDIKKMYEVRGKVAIGAAMPDDFQELHAKYRALKDANPALADAYFPGEVGERMALYDSYLTPGNPGSRGEAVAFTAAFGTLEKPRPVPFDKKGRDEAMKALTTQHSPSWWNLMGEHREALRSDQAGIAMAALEPTFEQFRRLPGVTIEESVRRGLEHSRREQGVDMVGGFFVPGIRGQQPLTTVLQDKRTALQAEGTGEDAKPYWDAAVKGFIKERAEKVGASFGDPIVIVRNQDTYLERNGDRAPVAWLTAVFKVDGQDVPVNFSSMDIKQFAKSKKAAQAQQPSATPAPTDYGRMIPQ